MSAPLARRPGTDTPKGCGSSYRQRQAVMGCGSALITGEAVYDPLDDRFDFWKSTVAAIKYLRDLNNTEAQASGLLVMASYNWGENNIRQIISRMPENPRERNFWRLLSYKDIPRETYDYVFSIFSAAVICENQRPFRF